MERIKTFTVVYATQDFTAMHVVTEKGDETIIHKDCDRIMVSGHLSEKRCREFLSVFYDGVNRGKFLACNMTSS